MTGKKFQKRIEKLESVVEELLDYLKLESSTEEKELFDNRNSYYETLIVKKKKDDW